MSPNLHDPPIPGSVLGPPDPFTDLPEAASIEGAPALAAIRAGIGAYLEANGYVAEHPLVYVSEAEDPYVYVRFDLSEDGLGFLDATYVYSPGVAEQLDEIFTDYGVYEEEGRKVPYEPECYMLGRPIHARILSLETCSLEMSIAQDIATDETASARATAIAGRRRKGLLRRCKVRRAAMRRLALRGGLPKFGIQPIWPPKGMLSLPLNWDMSAPAYEWSNWSVDGGIDAAADQSLLTWRGYVEPRLIHTSRNRGKGVPLESYLTFPADGPGNGILGEEWLTYDRSYWFLKTDIISDRYFDDLKYTSQYIYARESLYWTHKYIDSCISVLFQRRLRLGDSEAKLLDIARLTPSDSTPPADKELANAAARYRRDAAIIAFRYGIDADSDWRQKARTYSLCVGSTVKQILRRASEKKDIKNSI